MNLKYLLLTAVLLVPVSVLAQSDRHDVRAGNRKFRKDSYKAAEIDYRKAALKDSLSVAAEYNLASSLYRQEDYEGASKALEAVKDVAASHPNAADYYYNKGDVALQKKDYGSAAEAFKQSLLLNPGDLDAKENYIYAKKMMKNDQNGGGGDNNQDNNQDQNQNQDQDQNQNQDQDQDQDQDQNQDQDQQPLMSKQQMQQMLNAIQAKEKETQDKVNKEKAAVLQSQQKEKNW